ncbi:MAG: UDP-N-acetyl-D-glucosamine dehydrogenase [Armatimonadetes bacterium CG_4_10_14_3_um_filter_66_18]|nr:nucleotide sugar dehydrogenase [Armatimonadota bacterium]OIO95169.1 MAG: UDP-N-acetyl-D-glucosamine dehydrogenase [Armatimonadetes bacterium CG2_30_66_41]PIU92958.1 MAG: UDP-N-acetyl-D-glucosamine dehydrogenase [Armatimonadetes bacterium CG06_land_8_20_14_3_00_66_21]PIX40307.1 MAG: UDP-N-acetyl-D-glucosamine dehydrogenase [Armatimonadetes bacterium CG_4_8_14_3_um_filter_66_20]PIY37668.1 MAG: UDP-N-acetyl-D-glucosamine dehydrogenase [Armatimonadetes bacterium CG_4_10_14_3_um_filter_66_18]PIZ
MELVEKLQNCTAEVAVMGMGYVGLPLALALGEAGFEVWAVDVDEARVRQLREGKSYLLEIEDEAISKLVDAGKLRATTEMSPIRRADAVIVCVPTPLSKTRDPDLSYVVSATAAIAEHLRPPQLVILESTTYPGTTEEIVLPQLEKAGWQLGVDFHLAFSPERIDPGNEKFPLRAVPKVVGGITAECTEAACALYAQIIDRVVPVSCPKVAETCKLLENIFRSVNIALINEMALLCDRMGIDVWEVIEAAATKPYGFMKFTPGPGLGGHCIPIDPFYLSWKAHEYDFRTRFIELSGEVNAAMPGFVLSKVSDALNARGKSVKGSTVLMLGLAYKPDVNDVRESPSLKVADLLLSKEANLIVSDPHVVEARWNGHPLKTEPLTSELIQQADCVLLMTNHTAYDYADIADKAQLIIDTRNAFAGLEGNIVKL